jgi:hypothetical protein
MLDLLYLLLICAPFILALIFLILLANTPFSKK